MQKKFSICNSGIEKTLALSMLRTFFEDAYDDDGTHMDNSRYFEGKKIMEADSKILIRTMFNNTF